MKIQHSIAFALALAAAAAVHAADWPMWGGTPSRNMVSDETGIPRTWDVNSKENIKWVAEIGSQSYGNPVVAEGKVFLGTNNQLERNPEIKGDKGVMMVFDEKTGALLGAHMVGAEVTELIQGYVVGRQLETTEEDLMNTVFPHPTLSEMMHESVLDAWGRAIHY